MAGARNFFDENDEPVARRASEALHRIGTAMRNQAWASAGCRKLTPTQGQILAALRRGPLRLTELAADLGVTSATTSEAVRALVDKGLVEKERDPNDARAVQHRLTAAGEAEAETAASWPDFLIGAIETLTPAEQQTFLVGLIKMIHALQDVGQAPPNRMCLTCAQFRPDGGNAERPHYCAHVKAPLALHQIRIDCAMHTPAAPAQCDEAWARFLRRS